MINNRIHNGHHLLSTYSGPGTAPIRARAWAPATHILGALSNFLLGLYLLIFARRALTSVEFMSLGAGALTK